jgi:hypothetical protein
LRELPARWAATKVAVIYFVLYLLVLWLVPFVPAEPKLGPVYTKISHLVPLEFPWLLFAGAAALDFWLDRLATRNKWLQATVAGIGFVLMMMGSRGRAEMAVPVAAFAQRTLRMQRTTAATLTVLMMLLVLSLIAIVGAAVRENQLEPGQLVPPSTKFRGRMAMAGTAVTLVAILFLGNAWWTSEATTKAHDVVYKAPPIDVSLAGNQLTLKPGFSHWHDLRKSEQLNKIIPDHGHPMHLFLVGLPELDEFAHLHPEETETGAFSEALPALTAGRYALFADVVRESGFPDTVTAQIDLPGGEKGKPISGDDSTAVAPRASTLYTSAPRVSTPTVSTTDPNVLTVPLGADEHVEWVNAGETPQAQRPMLLRFHVVGKNGARQPISSRTWEWLATS